MNIFLVNQDDPNAESLCRKLSEQSKPGAIIPLSTGEMELYDSVDFQYLNTSNSANSNIVEVKKGGSYIFVCDPDTNVDDVVQAAKMLNINAGIIRTC